MWSVSRITFFLILAGFMLVLGKRKNPGKNKGKQQRPKPSPLVKSYNVSSLEGTAATCPGKYLFEEGDLLELTSPGYPKRYPNRYNCQWDLEASGCQFKVECDDLFTRPSCSGN